MVLECFGNLFPRLDVGQSYIKAQEQVSKAFKDKARWGKMAVLNTARVGKFSSDRTIAEYAKDIWKLKPVKVS
ncbi:MAG: glycogen/starch/alpha-glucan phosphorylase [Chthoniobacterales bacterium]